MESSSRYSSPDPRLRDLVESTAGLQPARRVFHAGMGVVVAAALWWVQPPRTWLVPVLVAVLLLLAAIDLARLRFPALNLLFFRSVRLLASPREASGFASSTWYVVGILAAVVLFPLQWVVPAILVLALADPAANLLGRRWGRRPMGTGSLEGVAVFTVIAFAVLLWWASPAVALMAALAGAIVEVLPWKLDDNLTIPLTVAAALWLLSGGLAG